METAIQTVIQRLHTVKGMASIAISGGGAQALTWLLTTAGASKTILEINTPYSRQSLSNFLGKDNPPVNLETAVSMAKQSYQRAISLRNKNEPVTGLGCTASIISNKTKKGLHRCHIAVWNNNSVSTYSMSLIKGRRDRVGEDRIVSYLILKALADSLSVRMTIPDELSSSGEKIERTSKTYDHPLDALLAEHICSVLIDENHINADEDVPGSILPGSFAPLHNGHKELAKRASLILKSDVLYEMSISNVDKPPMPLEEIHRRIQQFSNEGPLVITNADRFDKKADLFPGRTFVVGVDTVQRLVNSSYYGNDQTQMLLSLQKLNSLKCDFLVAGRELNGDFVTLENIHIPERFSKIFSAIPETQFRSNLSSTNLRNSTEWNTTK
ncbi:MAG: hypothetical protein VX701_01555 [Chloroflexota bacterium]|nr:hypothetical protein [Chloroflexota bacterium]